MLPDDPLHQAESLLHDSRSLNTTSCRSRDNSSCVRFARGGRGQRTTGVVNVQHGVGKMPCPLPLPFADIYDNSLSTSGQRLPPPPPPASAPSFARCRHSSRRCSPGCSGLLVSPTHSATYPSTHPRFECSVTPNQVPWRVPSPRPPPVVSRRLFFFAARSTLRLAPLSPFSMHISSHYSRYAALSTPCRVRRIIDLLRLRVLPPNPGYGVKQRTPCAGPFVISVLTFH